MARLCSALRVATIFPLFLDRPLPGPGCCRRPSRHAVSAELQRAAWRAVKEPPSPQFSAPRGARGRHDTGGAQRTEVIVKTDETNDVAGFWPMLQKSVQRVSCRGPGHASRGSGPIPFPGTRLLRTGAVLALRLGGQQALQARALVMRRAEHSFRRSFRSRSLVRGADRFGPVQSRVRVVASGKRRYQP